MSAPSRGVRAGGCPVRGCGARLEYLGTGGGDVVERCPGCARVARGQCQDCPAPLTIHVAGARPRRCAACARARRYAQDAARYRDPATGRKARQQAADRTPAAAARWAAHWRRLVETEDAEARARRLARKREQQRAYAQQHRDEIRAKKQQHYAEHREAILAARKVYHAMHRERLNAERREWTAHKRRVRAAEARTP